MKKIIISALLLVFSIGLTGCAAVDNSIDDSVHKNNQNSITKVDREKPFKKIDVNVAIDNVKLNYGKHYKVSYHGSKKLLPKITNKNGLLTIVDKNFSNSNMKQILTIELPKKELKNINIFSQNGDVIIDSIKTYSGNTKSTNGDIKYLHLCSNKEFKINTQNGNIIVKDNNAKGYNLVASNGNIRFKGNTVDSPFKLNKKDKKLLSVYSENGNIDIEK